MSIFHRIKKGHYITSDSIAIDKERTLKDFANLKNVNAVSDTNYPNENSKIATMNFLSWWNGAYNSNKNSNLQYCKNGEILGSQSNVEIKSVTVKSEYISDVDVNIVTKYGKICRVDFRGKTIADIPNNTTFLKLPYEPTNQITIMGGVGGRYDIPSPRWMYSTSDGEIRDGVIAKDNYIHLMFTYICK